METVVIVVFVYTLHPAWGQTGGASGYYPGVCGGTGVHIILLSLCILYDCHGACLSSWAASPDLCLQKATDLYFAFSQRFTDTLYATTTANFFVAERSSHLLQY